MKHRLRIVSNNFRGFFTGQNDHDQLLIGFLLPGLVLVRFDKNGEFVDVEERVFSDRLRAEWRHPVFDATGRLLRPNGMRELRSWQDEIGFRETPIALCPFTLYPRYPIVLDICSGMSRYIVAHPDEFDAEEQAEAQSYINEWQNTWMHAFTWNEECLMYPDGRISST